MHHAPAGSQPVFFIDQPEALQHCLQQLARSTTLSFDLEFDSNRNAYGVTLCLIQVASANACFVIDPMTGLDLSGVYALFAHPGIQKIVHAPGEDLRLLHSLGCFPKNLFDTEVVARLLNYEQTSLTALLRNKLGHDMDKKHQKSNWLRRPLSEGQVRYAAEDVVWLHPLKTILEAEAESKGLMPFVLEEQELLSTFIHQLVAKASFLKPSDLVHLSPQHQYLLNELLRFRDELARQMNKPAYQIMGEELVRALAAGTLLPESILYGPDVHPRLKTQSFVTQLSEQLRQAKEAANAKGLAAEKGEREPFSPARHAAHRKAAHDREHLFAPVQAELVKRYGTYATQLLLSNRMVNEILNGTVAFTAIKPHYRQVLIKDIAAELGIDLSSYD